MLYPTELQGQIVVFGRLKLISGSSIQSGTTPRDYPFAVFLGSPFAMFGG